MAAKSIVFGLDGWALLTEENPDLVIIRTALAEKVEEMSTKLDDSRAKMIANAVGQLFKGK